MQSRILDCWFLTGPTASGKTAVGFELAQLLGADIISLDSMTVYRGMDIGTAKPSPQQRIGLPHHLIDIREPTDVFSVSDYVEMANDVIDGIRSREREVLFVGGTPLYLKALLRGIFQGPPADWEFRQQIEQEVQEVGLAALHQRLMQIDPLSATKLHHNDKRRMIRALEVYRLTGQPISHLQTQFDDGHSAETCKVFVLDWPRVELHRRIDARVNQMFDSGLVEEVRRLLEQHGQLSHTASQAVGYREVIQHLRGDRDIEETRELVKTRTRQFARRQETWFRSLSECRRIPQIRDATAAEVAEQIISMVESTDA